MQSPSQTTHACKVFPTIQSPLVAVFANTVPYLYLNTRECNLLRNHYTYFPYNFNCTKKQPLLKHILQLD